MPRSKPTPVATRHGATQPEDARRNAQLLLRLAPAVRDELRRRASESGMTISAVVSALVMATTSS